MFFFSFFIEFLRVKKVPITEYKNDTSINSSEILSSIKSLSLSDRAIMEKGQKAYVSYIRAYKEHLCNLIFVFNKLPFGKLAEGMGLLYVNKKNKTTSYIYIFFYFYIYILTFLFFFFKIFF
jgi:hypothetical protein